MEFLPDSRGPRLRPTKAERCRVAISGWEQRAGPARSDSPDGQGARNSLIPYLFII